jgi:hypothetical protein
MDKTNTLFEIIHTLNERKLLIEKTQLQLYSQGKFLLKKECIKKKIKKTFFFITLSLKNGEKIILKEEPKTFFQGYSILLGEQTRLIKAVEEKSQQVYYFQEDQLEIIKEKITFSSVRLVPPQILNNKEYISIPHELQLIKEIKEYSLNELQVNLNTIHLVKSNHFEVFAPSLNEKHNTIGHLLKIPIKSCVSKNYFLDTTLHIEDVEKQRDLLLPLSEIKEEIETFFYNNTEVCKELYTQIHITLDKEILISKLQHIEDTNIDLKKIFELIKTKETIPLSNMIGTYILPLFKNKNFKTFPNKDIFKEELGIEYENKSSSLNSLKVRKNVNEDYYFKEYYLDSKLENILLFNQEEPQFCKNNFEYILKIILMENTKSILLEEEINENKIQELSKHIFSLSKFLIHKSVEYNCIPKEKRPQNGIEHYLLSKGSQLQVLSQEYNQKFSRKKLLKATLQTAQEISEIKKTISFEKESLYFLHQCLLIYINILRHFNKKKADLIHATLEEYFGPHKVKLLLSKINVKNDTIIKDISLANKLSNNTKCMVEFKKDLYKQYFSTNITTLPNQESFSEIYYRANIHKLKQISPYNYKNIAKVLNGKILPKTLLLQKREIDCTSEYYFKTRKHNHYIEIISNEVFSLFVKK